MDLSTLEIILGIIASILTIASIVFVYLKAVGFIPKLKALILVDKISDEKWKSVTEFLVPKFVNSNKNERYFQREFVFEIVKREDITYQEISGIARKFKTPEEYTNELLDELEGLSVIKRKNGKYYLTNEGKETFEYVKKLLELASSKKFEKIFF